MSLWMTRLTASTIDWLDITRPGVAEGYIHPLENSADEHSSSLDRKLPWSLKQKKNSRLGYNRRSINQ